MQEKFKVPPTYSEELLLNKLSTHYENDDTDEDDEEEMNIFTTNQKTRSDDISSSKRKNGNAYNQVTMLTPVDPATKVVINETAKTIKKRLKRGSKTYEIAPGEGKVCWNL